MMWKLCVDTGGTFTDCIATSPTGQRHRCKVLSNSSIRGEVVEVTGRNSCRIRSDLPSVDSFADGIVLEWMNLGDQASSRIDRYTGEDSHILLSDDLPPGIGEGTPFELLFADEAPILAARMVTRTPVGVPLPAIEMRLATTKGTNALLERRGAKIVFFTTRGFADLLVIDDQRRNDLFAFDLRKEPPLYHRVVEVDERRAADGSVVRELEIESLEHELERLDDERIEAIAIAFLNSYRGPAHEQELESHLRDRGHQWVSSSARLAPQIKILPRAQTAVVDAYLSPIVGGYLERIEQHIAAEAILLMSSAGGLVPRADYCPKDSLLSGPAGGVVGAAMVAREVGLSRIITFDMGGTSTDVARYDGRFLHRFEHRVGPASIASPALAIETIAAGGGSVCSLNRELPAVGPSSAGADPGPACYGRGGPLTITDCNLLLGRLDPVTFRIPLDRRAARQAARTLQSGHQQFRPGIPLQELLFGYVRIANQLMADAIRTISIGEGCDPMEYALVAFGGAGGQHACGVAQLLRIPRIVVPSEAGLLSAAGLEGARIEKFAQQELFLPLNRASNVLPATIESLEAKAIGYIAAAESISAHPPPKIISRFIYLRLLGQETSLEIELRTGDSTLDLSDRFKEHFIRVFGYEPPNREIEIEAVRVTAARENEPRSTEQLAVGESSSELRTHRFWDQNRWHTVPVFERRNLDSTQLIEGPALVADVFGCVVIEGGWFARITNHGSMILESSSVIETGAENKSGRALGS